MHSRIKHALQIASRLVLDGLQSLWHIFFTVIDYLTLAVDDLGDKDGLAVFAVVHDGAVRVDEFEKIDI